MNQMRASCKVTREYDDVNRGCGHAQARAHLSIRTVTVLYWHWHPRTLLGTGIVVWHICYCVTRFQAVMPSLASAFAFAVLARTGNNKFEIILERTKGDETRYFDGKHDICKLEKNRYFSSMLTVCTCGRRPLYILQALAVSSVNLYPKIYYNQILSTCLPFVVPTSSWMKVIFFIQNRRH